MLGISYNQIGVSRVNASSLRDVDRVSGEGQADSWSDLAYAHMLARFGYVHDAPVF